MDLTMGSLLLNFFFRFWDHVYGQSDIAVSSFAGEAEQSIKGKFGRFDRVTTLLNVITTHNSH